ARVRYQIIGTRNIRRLREQRSPSFPAPAEQSRQSLSHSSRFSLAQESRIESRDEVHAAWLPSPKKARNAEERYGPKATKRGSSYEQPFCKLSRKPLILYQCPTNLLRLALPNMSLLH